MVDDLVWLHCPAVPRGKSPKLHRYWQGPYRLVKQISDVLFLLQHRDSRRRRTVVHFDRLKPCVALPEATPLEENTVQRDKDQETTPLLVTQEEATITDPLDGIDEPEPLDVEVFQNPVDGKQMVAEEEITTAPVPPEVMGEPDLPQIEFPELPQIESRNPADQPSRKSNRRHKKPERFGHNIYD